MQVANALNNHIRILFNPKVEAFKLFDFLVAKSNEDRYLAQIIEIYEDKFDASQNVAKLKLFYKINENNEVMPYDNFTPNKECEILRINQEDVEDFINQEREVFHFATNAKEFSPLNMQYEFFSKNPIVLADKIENANVISLNLAKNLSCKKHVVIIDSTGVLDFDGAKKIKASKNFRIPLNYSTIDHVFDVCLKDSSLEFQAIGSEIINEIKKFARSQENGFIPFNTFTKVLLEQYKATPFPELRLLLARIKKFQMNEIFARNKKDVESLFKAIEKNPSVIIDLSSIETIWQKACLEYIISDLKEEVYLITRINDDNFDIDLINKIYNKKKNISFIPNVSYNYKKLPSIVQYCKNYILMPSLYQRTDFLDANFALSNLISEGCIIFGENTDNFLYIATDLEPAVEEKKKTYRKIALSLDSEAPKKDQAHPPVFASKSEQKSEKTLIDDSRKAIDALKDFEQEQLKENLGEKFAEPTKEKDEFVALQNKDEFVVEPEILPEKEEISKAEKDDFQDLINKAYQSETKDIFDDSDEQIEVIPDVLETDSIENILLTDEQLDIVEIQPENKPKSDVNVLDAELIEFGDDDFKIQKDDSQKPQIPSQMPEIKQTGASFRKKSQNQPEPKPEELEKVQKEKTPLKEDLKPASKPELKPETAAKTPVKKENPKKPAEKPSKKENAAQEGVEFSDEELDFFQIAQQSNATQESEKNIQKEPEKLPKKPQAPQKNQESDDDLDLLEMANKSIDNNFKDILNSSKEQVEPKSDALESENLPEEKTPLPVYKENQAQGASYDFKAGDNVIHGKYGKGVVSKVVQYEKRQLLQIEFAESGKKLLDPKVADIRPE